MSSLAESASFPTTDWRALHKPPVGRRDILILAVLLTFQLRTDRPPDDAGGSWGGARGLRLIGQARNYIHQRFAQPPTDRDLYGAALRAMLESLSDPYSEFLSPRQTNFDLDLLNDKPVGGIGVVPRFEPGKGIVVQQLLPGGPAHRAGITEGSVIVRVGSRAAADLTPEAMYDALRGEIGTTVSLGVAAEVSPTTGPRDLREYVLTRGALPRYSDLDTKLLPGNLGYIRLTIFAAGTARRLAAAVTKLQGEGMRGLILDFRLNNGGALVEGLQTADLFLSGGTIITIERRQAENSNSVQRLPQLADAASVGDFPLVIMVSRITASAAELVAGALAGNGRAVLIGERTFGKARIQEILPLPDTEASVKLTVARFLMPDGADINGQGLTPQIEVPLSIDEKQALLDVWRQESVGIPAAPASDRQLDRAMAELETKLKKGQP